ncbi:DUF2065 domain-containing protein [soil metagenome]
MRELITALGLLLVIEGLVYAFVPSHLKRMMAAMQNVPADSLRIGGVVALAAGVGLVWIARSVIGQ